ncbi:MAG: ChaN family lipoprotein [Rhodothermales bacterium]
MPRATCFMLLFAGIAVPGQAQSSADSTPADTTLTDAYRIYRADGQPASLDDIVAAMSEVEVVFIGEQHNDPVAHHLQAELLKRACQQCTQGVGARPLALSLEVFERDVQPILDEYLAGFITEEHFQKSSRPWNNYETDYKPLVEFARTHHLPVIAANAPRRYVNRVSRQGPSSLDSLSEWAKAWLPPLPYPGPTPEYMARWNKEMAGMMARRSPQTAVPVADGKTGGEEQGASSVRHGMRHMLDAQAFWDASMAYTIRQYLLQTPDALVLHVAGSYHVKGGLGMPEQLRGYRPGTRHLIVIMEPEEDYTTFDAGRFGSFGDFVILTNAALPRTFTTVY